MYMYPPDLIAFGTVHVGVGAATELLVLGVGDGVEVAVGVG